MCFYPWRAEHNISEIGVYKKEGGYRNYQINFRGWRIGTQGDYTGVLKVYKEIFVAKDTIQRDKIIEETIWCESAAMWIGQRPITSLSPRIWWVKLQPAQLAKEVIQERTVILHRWSTLGSSDDC